MAADEQDCLASHGSASPTSPNPDKLGFTVSDVCAPWNTFVTLSQGTLPPIRAPITENLVSYASPQHGIIRSGLPWPFLHHREAGGTIPIVPGGPPIQTDLWYWSLY